MRASERVVITSAVAGLFGAVQNSCFILISMQVILKFSILWIINIFQKFRGVLKMSGGLKIFCFRVCCRDALLLGCVRWLNV